MQAWYPCLKKKSLLCYSLWWGVGTGSPFFTLCAVKGFLWFRVLTRKDEGHPDMSCKKNSTENHRPTDHPGAWVCIYIQSLQRKKNKERIHTCTEEQACLFSEEEGTSLSIITCTTGLNTHLAGASGRIYSTVGSNNSKGGRRRGC